MSAAAAAGANGSLAEVAAGWEGDLLVLGVTEEDFATEGEGGREGEAGEGGEGA